MDVAKNPMTIRNSGRGDIRVCQWGEGWSDGVFNDRGKRVSKPKKEKGGVEKATKNRKKKHIELR